MDEVTAWGAVLRRDVDELQQAFAEHVKDNRGTHEKLYSRTERPSWAVTWVLTLMGGALGSLAVWALTH